MLVRRIYALSVAGTAALLAACGGGGGGTTSTDSGSNQSATYSLSQPVKLGSYPSIGVMSSAQPLTDYGTATLTFPEETATGQKYYSTTTVPETYGPKAHLTDVGTATAWRDGWTGKGSTISVIDDFTNSSSATLTFDPVQRKKDDSDWYGTYTAEYNVVYTMVTNVSHGNLVSNITGGDYSSSKTTSTKTLGIKTDSSRISNSCTINTRTSQYFSPTCSNSFYENYYLPNLSQSALLKTQPVPGVAAEAFVINNTLNLSSAQNPIKTVADLQGHLKNSTTAANVINLSLGAEISTNNRTFDEVMAEVNKFPLPRQINSVIAVAAGNGGAPCASSNLNGCNAVAVALAFQPETKNSTIVVGALTGTGTSENIAVYSTRAGILADRFILAHGETGFFTNMVGTSFAAPRVSGVAAILKQKYPSLTAAQISNIILLSADKDINNDGTPDFIGVSPIFGHGKLSLTRALALAGAI